MNFVSSILPWTNSPVRQSENLRAYLGDHLPSSTARYLPASITLFVDLEVSEAAVSRFLGGMTEKLRSELERRISRQRRFVTLGLLTKDEVESFLTNRTDAQPWAIYFSRNGGLGHTKTGLVDGSRGVIPCSTMQNHGVAWCRAQDGKVRTWLATSRREGQDWDWESDIGHESAHAAFAQVPFFVQSIPQIPDNALSTVGNVNDLKPVHIAQMIYLYSEIAVVALRGESRATATGLPVAKPAELQALMRLSAEWAGNSGFEYAATVCARREGKIDVNLGDEIFEIAAPILRLIPHLTPFTNDAQPPALHLFRGALAAARKNKPPSHFRQEQCGATRP
jgi:hypothetical protein